MSDGSRSRLGCITCRIRKKKCDEQRPSCEACRSRRLPCYGFDAPAPAWYLSKANWKEVRDSPEAKSLQTVAETRYKIRRKVASRDNVSAATHGLATQVLEDSWGMDLTNHSAVLARANELPTCTPDYLMRACANIWQLRPDSIWWDSKIRSLVPGVRSSQQEETRLLMLFLDVIHPISFTFYKLDNSQDRSWMLNRVLSSRALYCSALSISACFDCSLIQPPKINDIGICPRTRSLQSTAVRELQAELDRFSLMESDPMEDFVSAGIQILGVIINLEILEIFSMLQGYWEMHHQAARRILNHIEICAPTTPRGSTMSSPIETALATWAADNPRKRDLQFCIACFVWIDVLATSTFGAMSYAPCAFDYLGLLESGAIQPEKLTGCQGWVMAAIVKIARVEQWAVAQGGQMDLGEFEEQRARSDQRLAGELQYGIDQLENAPSGSAATSATTEDDIRLISIIWAYAAQILRQVTISDIGSHPDMDQHFVNRCLQRLEALPTRLVMRVSWPYTVAGCMSYSEGQHERFRQVLGRTMQDAQPPGIAWKGLIAMEECWRLRQENGDRRVGWREAMESLKARIVLT